MALVWRARWLWIAVGVVALDQATKYALERLTGHNFTRVILPGLLDLVHRHNPGVAFGLLADAESRWLQALLILFSIGAMVLLVWLLAKERAGGRFSRAGLALILGGATGNLIDRLIHSSVIDFIDVYLGSYHWPAFNVADSAITVGAALVLLDLLASRHPKATAKP